MLGTSWPLLILCGLLALAPEAPAQTTPDPSALPPTILQAPARSRLGVGDGTRAPLEGVVDPQAYLVGPGDVFAFAIGGRFPIEPRSTVTADGLLIVPEVGSFRVAGRTLAAVRADLRAALQRRYTNVDTDAGLAEPRRFVVHVSGAVAVPGRHAVTPVARVEDALAEAMDESPLVALRDQQAGGNATLPALRNVEVRRADGVALRVDLLRYYATGDTRYNPHLRDGDVVHVPTFRPASEGVYVEDRFGEPRAYDLRPDDTVADLLAVARGPQATDVEAVRLVRPGPDGAIETQALASADLAGGAAARLALRPLDRLLLVDANEGVGQMTVFGYVRFPGSFPVVEGETTLREAVERAGGLLPDALARGAYLERRSDSRLPFAYRPSLEGVEQEETRAAILDAQGYEAGRLSDLPFESRQFLTREVLRFRGLSLDLEAALTADAPPIYVRNGDRLVVPGDPGGVYVVGQVRQPGLVPYRPGADADAYVAAAGGRGLGATEVYVREAGTGALRPAADAPLRSGDYLFVDREAAAFSEEGQALLLQQRQFEEQQNRDRAQARYQFIGTVLGVVGTVVSAISLYVLATRDTTN